MPIEDYSDIMCSTEVKKPEICSSERSTKCSNEVKDDAMIPSQGLVSEKRRRSASLSPKHASSRSLLFSDPKTLEQDLHTILNLQYKHEELSKGTTTPNCVLMRRPRSDGDVFALRESPNTMRTRTQDGIGADQYHFDPDESKAVNAIADQRFVPTSPIDEARRLQQR